MSGFMYTVTIPPIIRSLTNLRGIVEKAVAYTEEKNIDPSVLVNARLYPDMFPLSRQIQIATDVAKGAASRLAGTEPPKFEDNETTFQELLARIDKTLDILKSVQPEKLEGSEAKTVSFPLRGKTVSFEGMAYLTDFVLPNVYFHVTTTFAILRHNGLDIGKVDYLGDIY